MAVSPDYRRSPCRDVQLRRLTSRAERSVRVHHRVSSQSPLDDRPTEAVARPPVHERPGAGVPLEHRSLPAPEREAAVPLVREPAARGEGRPAAPTASEGEERSAHLAIPADQPWCPPLLAPFLGWAADVAPDPLVEAEWTGPKAWRSAGVSMRGARQALAGMHREESIAVTGDADSLVVCLADGATSSRWARIAAEYVCRTVPAAVLEAMQDDPDASTDGDARTLGRAVGRAMGLATWRAWHELRGLATATRSSPADFRTTLLLGVQRRSHDGSYWFLNRIGDGTMLVRDRQGATVPAFPSVPAGERGDAGCRLPDSRSAELANRIRVLPARDVDALIFLSAGTERLIGIPLVGPTLPASQAPSVLRAWLMPVADHDPMADALADDEDRSVLVAWRSVLGVDSIRSSL